MAQRVYATASDYEEFAEEPFENPGEENARLNKRLRSASIEVEKLTRLSTFDADEDGYPTNADIADAFKEATCAVVEYWEETDDPTGADKLAGAVKIGSVSLGTSTTTRERPTDTLADRIGTRVFDILTNAGLISSAVSH